MSSSGRPRAPRSAAPAHRHKPKSLQALDANDCRWPIGDPRSADFHFCGKPRLAGRPYCELHWNMSMLPERPRVPPRAAA